jgi:hypothetical protein
VVSTSAVTFFAYFKDNTLVTKCIVPRSLAHGRVVDESLAGRTKMTALEMRPQSLISSRLNALIASASVASASTQDRGWSWPPFTSFV